MIGIQSVLLKREKITAPELAKKYEVFLRTISRDMLKDFMFVIGLLHDVGKYQESFVKRINGSDIPVEHSTCGALAARENMRMYFGT